MPKLNPMPPMQSQLRLVDEVWRLEARSNWLREDGSQTSHFFQPRWKWQLWPSFFPEREAGKKTQTLPGWTRASWQTSKPLALTRPWADSVICAPYPNPATFRGVREAVKSKPQTVLVGILFMLSELPTGYIIKLPQKKMNISIDIQRLQLFYSESSK